MEDQAGGNWIHVKVLPTRRGLAVMQSHVSVTTVTVL